MWGKAFSQIIWGKKAHFGIMGEFYFFVNNLFQHSMGYGGNNFLLDRGREGGGARGETKIMPQKIMLLLSEVTLVET